MTPKYDVVHCGWSDSKPRVACPQFLFQRPFLECLRQKVHFQLEYLILGYGLIDSSLINSTWVRS